MSREREQNSFTETVEANAQQHKFLTGKNYSNIRRVSLVKWRHTQSFTIFCTLD